jgi:two-component system nitrogen regulation sensor histidine kinase GlnL
LSGGAVFIDPDSKSATLSPDACLLLGLSPQSPQQSWEKLPASLVEVANLALKSGPLPHRTIQFAAADATHRGLEVSAFPVGRDGNTSGVILLLADSTALRECEERLQRLDRLANLGTLAASMAHEIKNALVAGRTFVDLLLEKNPKAELTDVVRRELARIDAIVARLLKFARPARPNFADVHVHDSLEHALRLLQPQLENRGIGLDRRMNAASDLVTADEGELLQAFMNLLLNALEALAPEGKLSVITENVQDSQNTGTQPSSEIRITIADDGIGIPGEHLDRLFEPFFTTKSSGTGLGLAVTKRIIQEHRGVLTVESQPGKGTSFFIALPLAMGQGPPTRI